MKLNIGITGGIGAGKSTVSKVIESLGFDVFYSDNEAKNITNFDTIAKSELVSLFGKELYSEEGLNKSMLANIIFNDPKSRELVNAIIHPKVRLAFSEFAARSTQPLVFNEAAILFETGACKQFDKTILVTAPQSMRVQRVVNRDGSNSEAVKKRIESQWSDDEKMKLADYIIVNDETQPLLAQIEEVVKQLLA